MVGIDGRAGLLVQLGKVLGDSNTSQYFGGEGNGPARPGNMVDYLRSHPSAQNVPSPTGVPISVPVSALWEVIIHGLGGVWPPSRTKLDGTALGDVWKCDALTGASSDKSSQLVAFHKLSQWLK